MAVKLTGHGVCVLHAGIGFYQAGKRRRPRCLGRASKLAERMTSTCRPTPDERRPVSTEGRFAHSQRSAGEIPAVERLAGFLVSGIGGGCRDHSLCDPKLIRN